MVIDSTKHNNWKCKTCHETNNKGDLKCRTCGAAPVIPKDPFMVEEEKKRKAELGTNKAADANKKPVRGVVN